MCPGFTRQGDVTLDDESLWAPARRPAHAASARRHAVPAAEPVPDVDQGQRGRRRQGPPHRQGQAARRGVRAPADRGRAVGRGQGPARTTRPSGCRAASSSCSAWPGPWPSVPRSCCSTSRPRRSTRVTTESIEALLKTLTPALTLIVVTHNLGQAHAGLAQHDVLLPGGARGARRRPTTSSTGRAPGHRALRHRTDGLGPRQRTSSTTRTWRHVATSKSTTHEAHTNQLTRRKPVNDIDATARCKRGAIVAAPLGSR